MYHSDKLADLIVVEPLRLEADPFSLEALVAWLEKQSRGLNYNYRCGDHCLIAQYLKSTGHGDCLLGGSFWYDQNNIRHDLPERINRIAVSKPWTLGAALQRALALRSDR